jgi:hypothetical protein
MAFAQEEHPVEALGADRPDEPFGIGVGLRCPPGRAQDLDPLGAEYLVKDWAESLVPVMDQVADRAIVAFSRLGQVSGDLGAPSRSMKKSTWRVFKRTDSTVKRSQAMIDEAWVRMN